MEQVYHREAILITDPKICSNLNVFSKFLRLSYYGGKEVSKELIVEKVYYREATGTKDMFPPECVL